MCQASPTLPCSRPSCRLRAAASSCGLPSRRIHLRRGALSTPRRSLPGALPMSFGTCTCRLSLSRDISTPSLCRHGTRLVACCIQSVYSVGRFLAAQLWLAILRSKRTIENIQGLRLHLDHGSSLGALCRGEGCLPRMKTCDCAGANLTTSHREPKSTADRASTDQRSSRHCPYWLSKCTGSQVVVQNACAHNVSIVTVEDFGTAAMARCCIAQSGHAGCF